MRSRRRRKHSDSDSLELLLDTICNMFGGIILMAVLIVMQTRISAGQLQQQTHRSDERALDTRKLLFEIERLEQQIEDVVRRKDQLGVSHRAEASHLTIELLDVRRRLKQVVDQAIATEKRIRDELNRQRQILAENELGLQEIAHGQDAIGEQMEIAREEREKTERERSRNLRLPHQRRNPRVRFHSYAIEGNQVYAFEITSWHGPAFRSGQCWITPISGPRASVRIQPLKDNGYPVQLGISPRQFLDSLSEYEPSSDAIAFRVRGDSASFTSFQQLKVAILEQGYLYHVLAYLPEKGLLLYPARSLSVE